MVVLVRNKLFETLLYDIFEGNPALNHVGDTAELA